MKKRNNAFDFNRVFLADLECFSITTSVCMRLSGGRTLPTKEAIRIGTPQILSD